jgi:meiotic recombination protein SPO11
LDCGLDCLHVHANHCGKVVGSIEVTYDGYVTDVSKIFVIDYTKNDFGGNYVPVRVNKIIEMKIDAKFILLIESNSILSSLHASRFDEKYQCIIVSG